MLKNEKTLLKAITHILESGANEIRLLNLIQNYIDTNYVNTDWREGNIISNGTDLGIIQKIDLCVLLTENSCTEYQSIESLKLKGYDVKPIHNLTYENIALKFNVDIPTIKLLLKKLNNE